MKKLFYNFLLIIISASAFAQQKDWRPVYNTRWAYLYQRPDNKSEKIGVLASEASITLLDSTVYFYKVRVSNNDVGFIEKQPIDTRMFGRKQADEPKEYFYRGEQGQQCPHKFVRVSGLKARSAPSINARVIRVLPINDQICLDYVPFDKDGWVYIGDHFNKRPEFIQYKYLGDLLSFEGALKDYHKAKDKNSQKTMVERLVEIGWSGQTQDALTALKHFKNFHEKNGSIANYPNLEFEIFMVQQLQNPMNYDERVQYLLQADLHFEINGKKIYEKEMTENFAKNLGLKRTKEYDSRYDCGWEPEFRYVSSFMEIVFEKHNEPEVIVPIVKSMKFNQNQALVLNKIKIDHNYSERDFVKSFGKVISVMWNYAPHVYRIADGDAGFIEISFKNGKPVKYEVFFYC